MKNIVKIICTFSTFLLVFSSFFSPTIIKADPLADLNAQILAKQKEQQLTLQKIKDINASIKNISNNTSNLNSLLSQLQTKQKELNTQSSTLDQQIIDQDKSLADFNQILSQKQDSINKEINYLYKLSFMQPNLILGNDTDLNSYLTQRSELNYAIDLYKSDIKDYYAKIELANQIKDQSTKDKQTTLDTINALSTQISDIQKQIASNQAAINNANSNKNSLNQLVSSQNRTLDELSAMQKTLMDQEQKLYISNPSTTNKIINSGELYFYGRGNDYTLYSHGVGMSQYGALGAAVNAKMNANQILNFYYTGVSIIDYHSIQNRETINVAGYGTISIDDYVSGIGEVPDAACEDLGIAFSLNNFWKCWPKETIKAQVIAARTYALNYTKNGATICTTAACQVYKGGQGKKWANEATKNQVITYNGGFISAVYSADNSQGFGTANNDTVWSNNYGIGTPYAYLRAKDDTAFAFHTSANNVEWTTNGYKISDIQSMMQYIANNPALYTTSSFFQAALTKIGTLKSIQIVKDPSRRVKYVILIGTNLATVNVAGWLFKAIFATWNCKQGKNNIPNCDYILSLTFDFSIK